MCGREVLKQTKWTSPPLFSIFVTAVVKTYESSTHTHTLTAMMHEQPASFNARPAARGTMPRSRHRHTPSSVRGLQTNLSSSPRANPTHPLTHPTSLTHMTVPWTVISYEHPYTITPLRDGTHALHTLSPPSLVAGRHGEAPCELHTASRGHNFCSPTNQRPELSWLLNDKSGERQTHPLSTLQRVAFTLHIILITSACLPDQ